MFGAYEIISAGKRLRGCALGAMVGAMAGFPAQANVNIADVPLFLSSTIEPNLMFILDDSGSMQFEIMPGNITYTEYLFPRPWGLYGGSVYNDRIIVFDDSDIVNTHVRSSHNNKIFYNPENTYEPWSQQDGSLFPDADPTNAYHNPTLTGLGGIDLTSQQSFDEWLGWTGSYWDYDNSWKNFYPITFYRYKGTGSVWSTSSYVKYQIRGASGYRTDLATGVETSVTTFSWPGGVSRTVLEERQNFANWYTYYRSRVLAARAGIGKAFSEQGQDLRVGFGAINKGSTSVDGQNTGTIIRGVRSFSGTDREDFFDELYEHVIPAAGTPLRRALDDAGQYYSRTDNYGPWGKTPGTNDTASHLECRQSFTIMMTDGYWSSGSYYDADTSGARDNNDGTDGPTITDPDGNTYTYDAESPFTDSHSNTLADVAMYYWKNDLRTGLDNLVPNTIENPAFWQHMVTFGVGLGVSGTIDPDDAFNAIDNPSAPAINWPDPSGSNAAKLDDLLHAAVNARGGFFSADDPITFADELSNILSTIVSRVDSSSTSAAASSATLQSDTLLYTAGFRSSDWSGQLVAREIKPDGTVASLSSEQPEWNAETELEALASSGARKIFTSKRSGVDPAATQVLAGGKGILLDSSDLSNLASEQVAALNHDTSDTADSLASNRVEWLYGDDSAHASFRSREALDASGSTVQRLMGDIIGSNPQFAGKRDFGYRRLTGLTESYVDFRSDSSYQSRPDVLYVGANDGLLHAFNAKTGEEYFSYMPSELLLPESGDSFARINHLLDQDYDHRYYVDGTPTIWDAYWGNSWKTVLIGTMGAGGRTVFALDVTDPQSFSQSDVLWEFTDPDLGYGVSKPAVVRMQNGDWAAIFGNGYNSANHKAVLYIVRLEDGQLLAKINTNESSDDASSPNGLATPTVTLDIDTMSANLVYAGDLKGRMWRFDVSDSTPGNWVDAGNRTVLFEAEDSSGTPQPITAPPEVAVNPEDADTLIVTFGTGSYFRNQDANDTQVQSLYGIIDDNGAAVARSDLLTQSITWEGDLTFNSQTYTLREVSNNSLTTEKGWVLDLVYSGNAEGERVISKPLLLSGATRNRVRFSTLIPEPDPCAAGARRGFVMDVLLGSGGVAPRPVFDLNGDGVFDDGDKQGSRNFSGMDFGSGEELTLIQDGEGKGNLYDGEGNDVTTYEPGTPAGRQSWGLLR